jgi:DNA end-binding protein Ku
VKITKYMLNLARHIVKSRSADFEPEKFEDRCENALVELLNQKRKGEPIRAAVRLHDTGNVVNLMDALRRSLSDVGKGETSQTAKWRKPKKAASGQREMLMAIVGKGEDKAKAGAEETKRPTRQCKAG